MLSLSHENKSQRHKVNLNANVNVKDNRTVLYVKDLWWRRWDTEDDHPDWKRWHAASKLRHGQQKSQRSEHLSKKKMLRKPALYVIWRLMVAFPSWIPEEQNRISVGSPLLIVFVDLSHRFKPLSCFKLAKHSNWNGVRFVCTQSKEFWTDVDCVVIWLELEFLQHSNELKPDQVQIFLPYRCLLYRNQRQFHFPCPILTCCVDSLMKLFMKVI